MSEVLEQRRPQIAITRLLPRPNEYTKALISELRDFAIDEERAPLQKGKWSSLFGSSRAPLDLEIGTGNGTFFQHQLLKHPERNLLGIELKYKPLIQTIRGALRKNATNGRVLRFHALNLDLLFEKAELDNVYIHFPDPWTSPRKPQNRVMNRHTLDLLFGFQRPGSFLEFKTDSREYFLWALEEIQASKYRLEFSSFDLHAEPSTDPRFMTTFERLFVKQGLPINYIKLKRD